MSLHLLRRELWIPRMREEVFEFFAEAANLERITPPWLHFHILSPQPIIMRLGAEIEYKLKIRGVPAHWVTEITAWDPPHLFRDEQRSGPYKSWRHTHYFEQELDGTRMVDEVYYELPFGPLGDLVHRLMVRADVEQVFNYRNACISALALTNEDGGK